MDPNACLQAIRAIIKRAAAGQSIDSHDLCEYVEALDEWLKSGGFLPQDWYREPRAPRWNMED